jgi:Ca2+-binding RTX toxin-like protein
MFTRSQTHSAPEFRPHLEPLEGRALLAAGISLSSSGVIVVTGGDGYDYAYVNTYYGQDYGVGRDIRYRVTLKTGGLTYLRTYTTSEAHAGVIEFHGGKGRDTFTNNISARAISDGLPDLVVRAWGGPGDDALKGGTQDDELYGEEGNDTLGGYDGDDLLLGGAGRDTLMGDAGNDRLDGGAGADKLHGGPGDDILYGGFVGSRADGARDSLWGNDGNDTFIVEWYYELGQWFNRDFPMDYRNDLWESDIYLNPIPPGGRS